MVADTTSAQLTAKRRLGFLSTFDKKIEGFRREMERLRRASVTGKSFGGKWPTEGLDRIAHSLSGAGDSYGLHEISEWAGAFIARLEAVQTSAAAPTDEDLAWLATQISALEAMAATTSHAARVALGEPPPHPLPSIAATLLDDDAKPGTDAPFIAPSRTTDPPPPPEGGVSGYLQTASRAIPAAAVMFSTPPPPAQKKKSTPPPVPKTAQAPPPPKSSAAEPPAARRSKSGLRPVAFIAAADAAVREAVRTPLSRGGFDPKEIEPPEKLLERALDEPPDLAVIDEDDAAPAGAALVEALAADPLTSYVPVVKLGTATGVSRRDALPKPVDPERLLALARRLATPEIRTARVAMGLAEPTLERLVEFVGEELREGILDAATGKTSERIPIPAEGRLMASVWGLIAQIRRLATEGTRGKIRFQPATSGQLGMMALAEAEEAMDDTLGADVEDVDVEALRGIVAVVADDDPVVRSLFERTLSEAGVIVHMVEDGTTALDEVRRLSPDVVISDILMPGMDGWELCGRLRSDYAHRHIPVILLSWKEDLLERLRGLSVDADDFMLKEVDRKQIVGRLARVLRPRFLLERQLGIHGDVGGIVGRHGAMPILRAAQRLRPNCRVAFRETWNYIEADFRDGELVAVTRTGSDGTFSSGVSALERLVCVSSGRFAVVEASDTPRMQFAEGSEAALAAALRKMNGLVSRVVDGALIDIETVSLDPDVHALYARIVPPKLRPPLERLAAGAPPREIILSHAASAESLEALLLDLVRSGAVREIAVSPSSGRPGAITGHGGSRNGPSPQPAAVGHGASSAWRWLAVAAVLALAVSVFFNVRPSAEAAPTAPTVAHPAPPPAAPPAPEPVAAPEPETAPVPAPELGAAPEPEPVAAPRSKSKKGPKDPEPVAKPAPSDDSGKIAITLPAGAPGPVAVSIDGKPRGNAPLAVSLPPGLHEVVFTSGGKRSLRMVSLKKGEAKTLAAQVAP